MKKSELKKLIREVIEEAQSAEIQDMTQALEQNPKFVDAAMQRYGNTLKEENMNRRSFIGKLAKVLAGAGIAASAISNAKAGPLGDMLRQSDAAVEKSNQEVEKLGYGTKNPPVGSTLEIYRKAKQDPVFKKFKEEYINAIDATDIKKIERIQYEAVKEATKRLSAATDFDKEKAAIVASVSGMIGHISSREDIKRMIEENPEWMKQQQYRSSNKKTQY